MFVLHNNTMDPGKGGGKRCHLDGLSELISTRKV